MATHPQEMVNHPKEDYIRTHPPKDQDVYIYCGPGHVSFVPCYDFGTGFRFELFFYFDVNALVHSIISQL